MGIPAPFGRMKPGWEEIDSEILEKVEDDLWGYAGAGNTEAIRELLWRADESTNISLEDFPSVRDYYLVDQPDDILGTRRRLWVKWGRRPQKSTLDWEPEE